MPTLGYWKIRGLAQPIRLMLKYVGKEFEDKHYEQGDGPEFSRAAWNDVKHSLGLDFPNLPYYIDGDVKITHSGAIMRYIGRQHDLLGKTPQEKANMDMALEEAVDFRNGVVSMAYNPNYLNLLEKYKAEKLHELLKRFDKWLTGKTWFAGANVTVVDFVMYELLDQHKLMVPGCLDKYHNLTAFVKRFEELPKIKEYMQSGKFMKRPINNKVAQFK